MSDFLDWLKTQRDDPGKPRNPIILDRHYYGRDRIIVAPPDPILKMVIVREPKEDLLLENITGVDVDDEDGNVAILKVAMTGQWVAE